MPEIYIKRRNKSRFFIKKELFFSKNKSYYNMEQSGISLWKTCINKGGQQ